jgi:two-component system NtrC family sensor kinase
MRPHTSQSTSPERESDGDSEAQTLPVIPRETQSEAPITEEVATTGRATLVEAPAHWLDRLLVVSMQLPYAEGPERVMRAFIDGLSAILPDAALGVRMPEDGGGERRVLRSEPPSGEQPICADASRMFPEVAHERAFVLMDHRPGTLHVASGDPTLDDDRSPIVYFLSRAALVGGSALGRAQLHEQAMSHKSELRALKSHMVQAEKLASLGQIAAGMVHELNNPLTSIVAYTDYLLRRAERQPTADPEDTERLRRIAESANRMLRFTRDLVSYARPSSEVPVPVPLHDVIQRALAFCEHEVAQADAAVHCAFDPAVTHVRGMPEQLAQIFVNLVTNACHAMAPAGGAPPAPDGDAHRAASPAPVASGERIRTGKLTITTQLVDGATRVRVVIADTGHGIAPSHLSQVFAPFFTTKGAGRGTGLGLSIVKNIVENHNGDIRVESDPPRGTQFTILLPVDPRG